MSSITAAIAGSSSLVLSSARVSAKLEKSCEGVTHSYKSSPARCIYIEKATEDGR
jgi:hypothetical protein